MSSTGYYQYHTRTLIHSGPGSIIRVQALFEGMRARRVVLLSNEELRKTGIVDQLVSLFKTNGGGPGLVGIFTDIAAEANCETVNAALRLAREVAADAILAVGGGGVLDVSKGVKYALHHHFTDIREGLQTRLNMNSWPNTTRMDIPHIAVATTAGSGAEVSPAAVFFNETLGVNCHLIDPFLGPDMAVLDANLTLGLSPQLTATAGMDALTHALEAVASPLANHLSDAHAFRAAQLITQNLPLAVASGKNVQVRSDLLQASAMAVSAFYGSLNTMPVHNCANAFGALYSIPHGAANAALLPVCIEVLPEFYLPNAGRLAVALNLQAKGKGEETLLGEVVACLRGLQDTIGLDRTFARWGVKVENTEKIVAAIMTDPSGMFYQIPRNKVIEIIRNMAS